MSAYISPADLETLPVLDPEPTTHCVVCNKAAPMEMILSPWRNGRSLTPDMTGWMRSFFPWPKRVSFMDQRALEGQWLCPADALEVAKFIAHRRTPMIDDEDLIG